MKNIPTKVWLPALSLALLALLFARPKLQPAITIQFVGATNPPPSTGLKFGSRLVFAVTNSSSAPMAVLVYAKGLRATDFGLGDSGQLPRHSGRYFNIEMISEHAPWTVSVRSQRVPGKVEAWLRSYGSKLTLCNSGPNSQYKRVKINTNETGLLRVEGWPKSYP
jgi:hypothetical protein